MLLEHACPWLSESFHSCREPCRTAVLPTGENACKHVVHTGVGRPGNGASGSKPGSIFLRMAPHVALRCWLSPRSPPREASQRRQSQPAPRRRWGEGILAASVPHVPAPLRDPQRLENPFLLKFLQAGILSLAI